METGHIPIPFLCLVQIIIKTAQYFNPSCKHPNIYVQPTIDNEKINYVWNTIRGRELGVHTVLCKSLELPLISLYIGREKWCSDLLKHVQT